MQTAVDISRRHGFRIYDSLILAAAIKAVHHAITEDMQHGQVIEGVRIENPFLWRRTAADLLATVRSHQLSRSSRPARSGSRRSCRESP